MLARAYLATWLDTGVGHRVLIGRYITWLEQVGGEA
jgi:hypothetical protein